MIKDRRRKNIMAWLMVLAVSMCNISPVYAYSEAENSVGIENTDLASRLSDMEPDEDYVRDEAFVDVSSYEEAEKAAASYGAEIIKYSEGIAVLKLPNDIETTLKNAENSVSVSTALHPQLILDDFSIDTSSISDFNDPELRKQWFHEKIHDAEAWNVSSGKGAEVAVLDTGTRTSNQDLSRIKNAVWVGNLTNGNDTNGHGTHVAGIIGAERNNNAYGCGVAPEAELYSVRVTEDGKISLSNAVEGIRKAIDKKVDVINMSFGATGDYKKDFQEYINEAWKAGIVVVAAAGNKSTSSETYPAACDHVIAVAAYTKDGALAEYSNYGKWVDIAAPGGSTGDGNAIYSTLINSDGFGGKIGTSQAAPMVSAAAALIYASDSTLLKAHNSKAADEIADRLINSADKVTYSCGNHSVTGGLNLYNAVANYKFRENSGYLTTSGDQVIGAGKTIKLQIANGAGSIVKDAKKAKNVSWKVSDTSAFSIKKGRLKCLKSAAPGTTAVVTAEYKGETVSACFTVSAPTVKAGFIDGSSAKVKTSIRLDKQIRVGDTLSVNDVSALTGQDVRAWTKAPSKTLSGNSVSMGSVGYAVKISKMKKIKVTGYDDRGNPVAFTPAKKGTYTVTYTTVDGSGKKFRVKIRVTD